MLGLSLAIRVGKRVLGGLIDSLMSAVKGRATYSENIADSKQVLKDIDSYELLDKASILLTPTAYSDARVHSVKTYTGDEFITNGDFSDGETGWTITGAAPSATQEVINGALVMYAGSASDANNALSKTDTLQGYNGHIYKLEITASDFTVSPNGYLRLDGVYDASNIISFGIGTSTIYFTAYRDFTHIRFFAGSANQGYTIDNVSIIDVSSDFDFDRASSATRINSDGLVQDMQSITDPELVLNGGFEELGDELVTNGDFEELGDDLVTNGTFDTDSDWTLGTGWSIANGKASNDGSGGSNNLRQSNILTIGSTYKITITVSDYVSGNVQVSAGASPRGTMSANGIYTFYQEATPTDDFYIIANAFEGSIDNVSVKEVPNWTLSSESSIINGELVIDALDGSFQYAQQDFNTIVGKTYKVQFDITEINDVGEIQLLYGALLIGLPQYTSVGTHTLYFTSVSSSDTFTIKRKFPSSTKVTIDNISVQQVDPNDRWTLGTGWSVEDSKLVANSSSNGNDARQLNLLEQSRDYRLSIDISKTSGTDVKLKIYNGSSFVTIAELDESSTVNFSTSATNNGTLYVVSNAFVGTIDNISIKDITFSEDVDLARINYDSNGENGHWLLEPTSTNLIPYSEDFSEWELAAVTVEGGYLAPDGSNNAYKVSGTVGSSSIYYQGVNATDTRTIWARTVSGTGTINLCSYGQNTNNNFTITEDWQRFEVNGTTTSTGGTNFYALDFRFESANPLSEVIIWGAQSEALSYATSYIPTYGSTVTRATETLTGSGNSTLINSTEGVLFAEIAALSTTEGSGNISLSDGTGDNRIYIYYFEDDAISVIYNINSTGAVINNFTLSDITSYTKIAARWGNSNFSVWINGTEVLDVAASNFTSNTLDLLNLAKPDGSGQLEGKCKAIAVFDEFLEDDELELLTGITNYGSFNELAQANGYTII